MPFRLLLLLSLLPAAAIAAETGDKTLSPYFLVEGAEGGGDALPLKSTSAQVEIAGVIAHVTVEQVYSNMGGTPLHARYVFPASTRAAVHGLTLRVGENTVEAQIKERGQARADFERAKVEGKSASLLEQERPNVFTTEVSNILPGDVVKVQLRYSELLVPTDGVYELVYPTVVLPWYSNQPEATAPQSDRWVKSPYLHQESAPTYAFGFRATLASGSPIQDVSVPSHKADVQWTARNQVTVALDPAEKDGGNRDVVLHYRLAGEKIESGLLLSEGPGEKFFLLTVEPPERPALADIPAREYVFIIDVSGSMHGFPLNTAKKLLQDLIGGLRPTDHFNVVLFSGAHQTLSPASLPATRQNIAAATALIDRQSGGGGTELLPALQEAMGLPRAEGTSRSFIVVTDGGISEEKRMFEYIRGHLGDANVFSFGIGSSVNRYLVDGVAKAGMGESFVVLKPDEAAETAARFRKYVESPVLTGIHVAFDGFEASELEPGAIPDLLAQRPIVLQGKWTGSPKGTVTVTGRTGKGEFKRTIDVSAASRSERFEALRYLWARARIAALSDFSAKEESLEEREEITRLGLSYGLLTRHTSFVAVLQQVRNATGQAQDVDQPLPLPEGVSDLAVGGANGQGDEPGLALLALLAGLVALIAWARRAKPSPA